MQSCNAQAKSELSLVNPKPDFDQVMSKGKRISILVPLTGKLREISSFDFAWPPGFIRDHVMNFPTVK